LLGVFAHPDDETFCAGGTFARYAKDGAEVMVVSATRGEAGQIRDARVGTRRTIAAVRETELAWRANGWAWRTCGAGITSTVLSLRPTSPAW
jgi:LmbE family N-acetylglucosaminyl deacetylase